jgi:hypothetical protein
LAKFRGLTIMGKYGTVIGRETHFLYVPTQLQFSGYGFFSGNHIAGFPHDYQTTEFRQTTV